MKPVAHEHPRRRTGQELTGADVLVVDEAAMYDDRDIAELRAHAGKVGIKIVGKSYIP